MAIRFSIPGKFVLLGDSKFMGKVFLFMVPGTLVRPISGFGVSGTTLQAMKNARKPCKILPFGW